MGRFGTGWARILSLSTRGIGERTMISVLLALDTRSIRSDYDQPFENIDPYLPPTLKRRAILECGFFYGHKTATAQNVMIAIVQRNTDLYQYRCQTPLAHISPAPSGHRVGFNRHNPTIVRDSASHTPSLSDLPATIRRGYQRMTGRSRIRSLWGAGHS